MTSKAAPARSTARALLSFAFKAAVATVLLVWLARSKSLDFSALRVLVDSPALFAINLLAWMAGAVILSTARWRVLLRLAHVSLPLWRGTQLQMMGLFFNVAVPGNVGGDVLKALYVARDSPSESRPAILLVAVIERLIGLVGLALTGALVSIVRLPSLWSNERTRPMILIVAALAVCSIAGPLVAIALLRAVGDRFLGRLGEGSRVRRLAGQMLDVAKLAAEKPGVLLLALGMSMAMHAISIGYFTVLTAVLKGGTADYALVATVFPIGLLSVVLPISLVGMGVGHVAFDQLYAAIGLVGGATIFNVFIIGQITPALIGVVPYLLLKRRSGTPQVVTGVARHDATGE